MSGLDLSYSVSNINFKKKIVCGFASGKYMPTFLAKNEKIIQLLEMLELRVRTNSKPSQYDIL